MRSQLARYVLRRLLVSEVSSGPPSFVLSLPGLRTCPLRPRIARWPQRRGFLGLFNKPPRKLKEINAEPGYETLLQYRAAENESIRPPRRADLVQAWRDFFDYKMGYGRVVNSTQALCAHRVFLYLCSPSAYNLHRDEILSVNDLRFARECLSNAPKDDTTSHLALSRSLYNEITARGAAVPRDFHTYVAALSQYGQSLEARDLVFDYFHNRPDVDPIARARCFIPVVRGLAQEGRETELVDLVTAAKKLGLEYDPLIHGIMTGFFAKRDRIGETKLWFNNPISRGLPPSSMAYYDILKFALRNDLQKWAAGIYEDLISRLETGPFRGHKPCWDTAFQWAVVLLGKGIDHIEHMLQVAFEHTRDSPNSQPNIGTINSLVKIAIDKDDPYLAERFIALGRKLGFEPNYKTYMLQLEYRIRAKDLDGAFAAYQSFREQDDGSRDREIIILNAFVQAMCSVPEPNYERVLDVTTYLEQRRAMVEPETVVAICIAFLKNDETYEVIDTLSLHTVHYSVAERYMVRKAFVNYCLDKTNSTARVWDAYALVRQFFPELEVEDRIALMDAFFGRRRPDMALHVLTHIQGSGGRAGGPRPTEEMYVRFMEGLGRCPNEEGLHTVHNMLKMDTTVQPSTRLFNALMIGYIACGVPHRALDFWKEVTMSLEGPSYATLEIVFRAYEVTSYGDGPAGELWEKIKRMEIEVPEHVYVAYVATMAAHGNLTLAKTLLDDMHNVVGKNPGLHA
ncbi:complex I intermediate-associated protein [Durotheca rogersii]|uniref:complex I intermediate-associated protein n=1 Tax=Durotheca rogersii TaxID=419775 RepID=UPI00221FDB14|nr:complex I intermediate-associated protein [Durotheca rogersii]KAI5861181.1 complex I intermediate-associated protein [Durotheca rogersii]